MIVLFGPQGSGNHLFGKIFSLHDDVHGWKAALKPDGYFIPHYKEPFNYYWNNIDEIYQDIMGGKLYAVTSISNPYIEKGLPKVPPVFEFIKKIESDLVCCEGSIEISGNCVGNDFTFFLLNLFLK